MAPVPWRLKLAHMWFVEPRQGYGYACAAGVAAATADILLFLDGDFSSLPAEMPRLFQPVQKNQAALVLGSRVLGEILPGAMPPHQRFGNWLTSALMRQLYKVAVTDLGPYRAIRRDLLHGTPNAGDDLRLAHRNDGKMRPPGRPDSRSARQLRPAPRRPVQSKRYTPRLSPRRLLHTRRHPALRLLQPLGKSETSRLEPLSTDQSS